MRQYVQCQRKQGGNVRTMVILAQTVIMVVMVIMVARVMMVNNVNVIMVVMVINHG